MGAALTTLVLIAAVGNQFATSWYYRHVRNLSLRVLLGQANFFHWSLVPPDDGRRASSALERGFWPDASGGTLGRTLGVGDERWLDWLANLGRDGLLVVGIGVVVAMALSRHNGGFFARLVSAWGATALAAVLVGTACATLFDLVSSTSSFSLLGQAIAGGGFGAQWALVFGLPIAFVAALLSKPAI